MLFHSLKWKGLTVSKNIKNHYEHSVFFLCCYIWNVCVKMSKTWHKFRCNFTAWKPLQCIYTGRKKSDFFPTSDTDRNLMHACKHKNPHEIRFFRILSEPFPNVVLNRIHIRYLDIRPMSKHTYPILHTTPNARATRLLIKTFNGILMSQCAVCGCILLRWKLFIGKKLHIRAGFQPLPREFWKHNSWKLHYISQQWGDNSFCN